ncbi:DUF456 domain-containing protein [bacterium]|nr:DUF456 domain-containing protein [bacterium]
MADWLTLPWLDLLIWSGAILCILAGLVGLVLPAIPGPPLLFVGLWLAAFAEQYVFVGTKTLVFLGVLTVLAVALDFIAGALGAKRFGASRWAVTGALIGAIVGIFFGLIGLLLGPFVGAVAGELASGRAFDAASRAGIGATVGLLIGTAAKLAIGLTMLGVFVFVRLTSS